MSLDLDIGSPINNLPTISLLYFVVWIRLWTVCSLESWNILAKSVSFVRLEMNTKNPYMNIWARFLANIWYLVFKFMLPFGVLIQKLKKRRMVRTQ